MKKILRAGALVVTFLLVSIITLLPLIRSQHLYTGIDMGFHLNRAYDLAQNLKNGNPFPFVTSYAFNHLGTQVNMAYGLLTVYPLAIGLLLFKNPIMGIYFGIILLQFIQSIIVYPLAVKYFRNQSQNTRIALIFTLVYVFSVFNLSLYIGSFSFGEVTASIFLPLVAYGTYSILYGEDEWWYLSLGMALVLYTHLLSVLTYTVFVAVLIIIATVNGDISLKKLKSFLYAVTTAILMSSFYIADFMSMFRDQKMTTAMLVSTASNELKLSNLILESFDNQTFGTFFAISIIIVLVCWSKITKNTRVFFGTGLFFLCSATPVFDVFWKCVDKTIFAMLQFPGRLLVLTNFCFALAITEAIYIWIVSGSKKKALLFSRYTIVTLSILISSLSWGTTFLKTNSGNVSLKKPTLSTSLPFNNYKVSASTFKYLTAERYNGVGDKDYWPKRSSNLSYQQGEKLKINIGYNNRKEFFAHPIPMANGAKFTLKSMDEGKIDLPFFYSKNLSVQVDQIKQPYSNSKRGTVELANVSSGNHRIKVVYKPTLLIKTAATVSIITALILLGMSMRTNLFRRLLSRTKKKEESNGTEKMALQ
ncbi:hypothetical protein [Limosilactobacillus ingluviei]|uniref:Membrane protein 6-pyruvoyl-tetrahydropterin synthase-related domain-containing protein n=1 Tax=Limosilactobacillus ingluviei DSM 15946 TaxID=1423760 RepID=A0A0R1UG44_9LACO|nr:hypothetical protein [Limosilactobacillus ingluviei]KRL89717.1 hypothetical protein FC43_GL001557 [Limosilactobacillus ingluviei DSM 15946]